MISYVIRKLRQTISILLYSFLIWCILSSSLLQSSHLQLPHNSITDNFSSKKIQLLIAHPDDEVMFFAPTLIELNKPQYHNEIHVTCFSTGNDMGLGGVRSKELERSLQILGIGSSFEVLDDETKFNDSMELEWRVDDVLGFIQPDVDVLLTFDQGGVSNHTNHISLYNAAIKTDKSVYALKTWHPAVKYSSTLLTNVQLLAKLVLSHIYYYYKTTDFWQYDVSMFNNIHIYSDLPATILGISAMVNGHVSQMVWFRWGWLIFSRYVNTNELIKVQ